ncbi:thiol-disulfide oxidoreductase LTO1 isoform X2 [Euphorbia lathyris]|uniref:thiol-disulfide oxidoreductase LTO1 isoform X2 n=1 Tax=Euphorbia lathyris TaxID=212925 RepID=UPI0033130CEE
MASSFIAVSSPSLLYRTSTSFLPSPPPRSIIPLTRFKGFCWSWRLKCMPSGNSGTESDAETTPSTSSSSPSFSNISTYNWSAALAGIGFLETAYLTYLKLTDSDAFCPIGGGTCGDILNSDYAVVFGVPLPAIGIIAYGLVAALSIQLPRMNLPFGINEANGRFILLATTTSMAAASGYFLYILSTEFPGASCSYCLLSAVLSFSLFFINLKDFGFQEIQKVLGLQLCIASLVIVALGTSYSTSPPVSLSQAEVELPFVKYEVTTPSSPFTVSLAKHLNSIGAKMYGAFWCSHCLEQKQMFGQEASKILNYVECFPDGYRKGIKIAKACADVKIEGFPTWEINGQVLSGEKELSELAELSGFESSE